MASGLSTLPVEALSNSNTADKKKANVEPTSTTEAAPPTLGLTVTPPTPAVLASEAYEGGHHQHQQLQPHILGGPDRVPQSFQELDEAMGGSDDGWSVSGVECVSVLWDLSFCFDGLLMGVRLPVLTSLKKVGSV